MYLLSAEITYPPTSCVCVGGFCVPTGNGFQCECPYGYMLSGTSHCVGKCKTHPSPGLTFCADSYFGIRSTTVLPQ